MSQSYRIKKTFDIGLAGKPALDVSDAAAGKTYAVYPLEYTGFKQRLLVKEGDVVSRGGILLENKKNEDFKITSPVSGSVKSVIRGARRFVKKIVIESDGSDNAEDFGSCSEKELLSLSRDEILAKLLRTGYIAFIRQRPFGGIADAASTPKSIFVNAMNTAPFQADAGVVAGDDPAAFQAGLDLLTNLTDGDVHLCTAPDAADVLMQAQNVKIHTFEGKHPAGNTSVHISRIDPVAPHDIVWTIRAVDLVQVGRLFLGGKLPTSRIIAIGGPGAKPEDCRHYRLPVGGSLSSLLAEILKDGEQRLINGDALTGQPMEEDSYLRLQQSSLTVVPEGRSRYFLGWMEPGFDQMSFSRLCASTFFGGHSRKWGLDTNIHGGVRALVVTGYYDRVMPMDIMVDYLIRAVLAGDTDEAIAHGILETLPEDFALCEFICPCKIEIQDIIANGLRMIEEEGI